jgi:hypothetical protein
VPVGAGHRKQELRITGFEHRAPVEQTLSRPWSKNGLLNARALDLPITVLSRSKNAAVRSGPGVVSGVP